MFLASIFARSQPYSSKETAQRALVVFIRNRVSMLEYYSKEYFAEFNAALGREDYASAINSWNHCIRYHWCNNSLYLATVTEEKVDAPFT